jgi:hypothetical protein
MNVSETAASKINELLVEEQKAGGGFAIKNPNAKSTFGCGRPSRPSRSGADELCFRPSDLADPRRDSRRARNRRAALSSVAPLMTFDPIGATELLHGELDEVDLRVLWSLAF